MPNEITEVTRRAIVDLLSVGGNWAGRMNEDDFLARIYDLTTIPSNDRRYRTAAGDIFQHRVMNPGDWSDDWVFSDSRFNLLYTADDEFLRFLCETVHPVVQPDADRVLELVAAYNQELASDGWEIVEAKRISNKPVFAARKVGTRAEVFAEPTGWQKVDRQVQEARSRLAGAGSEEQYQAVGLLCREVLISAAQEVFKPSLHPTLDCAKPSDTDAKRMLEAIFEVELKGGANEEARGHAKAAVKLALALQHKRTANFMMAALCAEATLSVVNLLAILAGRRDRSLS